MHFHHDILVDTNATTLFQLRFWHKATFQKAFTLDTKKFHCLATVVRVNKQKMSCDSEIVGSSRRNERAISWLAETNEQRLRDWRLQQEANKCQKISSFFSKSNGVCGESDEVRVPPLRIGWFGWIHEYKPIIRRRDQQPYYCHWLSPWQYPATSDFDTELAETLRLGELNTVTENNIHNKCSVTQVTQQTSVRPEENLEWRNDNAQEEHTKSGTNGQLKTSQGQDCQVYLFRGFQMNINAIVKKAGPGILSLYKEKTKKEGAKHAKTRSLIKCLVCAEFEDEAKRFAANSQVYLAHVVRCDGKKKIQDIVDHLHGAPHAAALEMKTLSIQWANKSPMVADSRVMIQVLYRHWFTWRSMFTMTANSSLQQPDPGRHDHWLNFTQKSSLKHIVMLKVAWNFLSFNHKLSTCTTVIQFTLRKSSTLKVTSKEKS